MAGIDQRPVTTKRAIKTSNLVPFPTEPLTTSEPQN